MGHIIHDYRFLIRRYPISISLICDANSSSSLRLDLGSFRHASCAVGYSLWSLRSVWGAKKLVACVRLPFTVDLLHADLLKTGPYFCVWSDHWAAVQRMFRTCLKWNNYTFGIDYYTPPDTYQHCGSRWTARIKVTICVHLNITITNYNFTSINQYSSFVCWYMKVSVGKFSNYYSNILLLCNRNLPLKCTV